MPTLAEIRAQCDAKLVTLQAAITSRQTTYAAAHNGRYWQGLITHIIHPSDGSEILPTVGTATPTDQPTVWPASLLSTAIPMSLQIDVYDGSSGLGYTVTLRVQVLGKLYQRVANVGPETYRAQPWSEVVPLVSP